MAAKADFVSRGFQGSRQFFLSVYGRDNFMDKIFLHALR